MATFTFFVWQFSCADEAFVFILLIFLVICCCCRLVAKILPENEISSLYQFMWVCSDAVVCVDFFVKQTLWLSPGLIFFRKKIACLCKILALFFLVLSSL